LEGKSVLPLMVAGHVLKIEEGISRLARITSNVIAVGEKKLVTVPRPEKACKELLKRVNEPCQRYYITLSGDACCHEKKLNSFRKRK